EWDTKTVCDRAFFDVPAADLPKDNLSNMSDSHLTGGKSLKKSSTQASGKDHSQLPLFGNFPKGHILRKIAAYHANRTSQKLPTISESDHPSSEAAPGQTAPIVGVRAAESDHAAAVGVADSGRQNPPLPSNIPRLGKGIQQRRMKVVREEQAAMIARKRGENISKKASSTMEVIKSDVFRNKVREIPEDLYQACVKNMPSEVMSYMPPGYIWWEMNPTMQSRVFWVVYARYYLKHQEKEYMGTVVEYYARKLGMSAWPPGFENLAETLDLRPNANKSGRKQESASSTPVSREYDTDYAADTNSEWSHDEIDEHEQQYLVDTDPNDREDVDLSALVDKYGSFQLGSGSDPFLGDN
ncbi:hypothetical protein GRF29_1g946625, partial [Pseudopithomyces chartarum]